MAIASQDTSRLGAARGRPGCYTSDVPTAHRRYTLTDTGKIAAALDVAGERWPGRPRRELLDLLVAAGAQRIDRERRLERQRQALRRIPELVDVDLLLSDAAWR